MFYVPTSLFMSESVIISSPSPVLTGQLCALYKPALCVKLVILNLIFDCLGFKFTMAVHGGLFIGWPLFCIFYVPCVFVWSGDIA